MLFHPEQIFIVTGASSGIGQDIALQLNSEGATVVGIARSKSKLEETKRKAKNPEHFHIETKDLSEELDALPKYITSLKKTYGKFTGLACCAGMGDNMSLKGVDMDDMRRYFNINYFSPIMLTKGFTDKRNNVGEGASVLTISSIGAIACPPGMTIYAGNKAALTASMKVISKEVAPQGIRVNTLAPALINTDMLDEDTIKFSEGKYPFGIGEVEDVSNLAIFLMSNKAKWITGQNYVIDCGSS